MGEEAFLVEIEDSPSSFSQIGTKLPRIIVGLFRSERKAKEFADKYRIMSHRPTFVTTFYLDLSKGDNNENF